MNGVLLGIILCAIFLTGIFTASSADTTADVFPSEVQTIPQSNCKPSLRNTEVHLGRRKKIITNTSTDIPQH